MKAYDDISSCDIELCSETLAVVLSECCRQKAVSQDRSKVNAGHRGGKTLFRTFVKENSSSVWKPSLVDSVASVRFVGFFSDPPTLLLQADAAKLQHIRDAWSNRLLRAPPHFHIDFVGDVTRIGARPLSRGRFIPLCDAVCVSIGNISSRDDVATQESVLIEMERSFPAVHSPSRELLHETLGKLIRDRKVFCTGPGYHLVTDKTYSGKMSKEANNDEMKKKESKDGTYECQACLQNRKAFASKVADRRSFRVKRHHSRKENEERNLLHSPTNTVESETLHGSVIPEVSQSEESPQKTSPRKSLDRENDVRKPHTGLVEKMTNKFFRRRNKSSSERRISDTSDSTSPKHGTHGSPRKTQKQIRELSPIEARRLGYVSKAQKQKPSRRLSTNKGRSNSESPVKRTSSSNENSENRQNHRTSERNELRVTTSARHDSGEKLQSPDRIVHPEPVQGRKIYSEANFHRSPAKHDNHKRLITGVSDSSGLKLGPDINVMRSPSNQFPKFRDAAVTCNLEDDEDHKNIESSSLERRKHHSQRRNHSVLKPGEEKRRELAVTSETPNSAGGKRSLRRSKSLRLPRERHLDDSLRTHDSIERSRTDLMKHEMPDYPGFHYSGDNEGLSYDSLRRSSSAQRTRQSISSASSGREYSYLHACHFAPSVRIGSVIADHLEELDRRRRLREKRTSHTMSPSSSLDSSCVSNPINVTSSSNDVDIPEVEVEEVENVEENNNQKDVDNEDKLDPETAAALEIAKRLAKLDIKMTRQEWTEYFSKKVLPSHVEQSLHEAAEVDSEKTISESPTSCFEDTSGSVETVIDLKQKDRSRSSKDSQSSRDSNQFRRRSFKSDSSDGKRVDSRQSVRSDDVFSQLKGTNIDSVPLKESNVKLTLCEREKSHNRNKCSGFDEFNTDEENDLEPYQYYICDNGHRHVPLCYRHKQFATNDSASLTEDSGFHSARERSSLSSWDTSKKMSETFV